MSLKTSTSQIAARQVPRSAVAALANGEIAGLDGLRALSVVCVMISHYGLGTIVPGALGVTVFFFISGFLITTLMMREAHATGSIAIGRFYARRVLRLQPELWALLIISGSGFALYDGWPRSLDWLSSLFYVNNYAQVGAFTSGVVPEVRWPQLWSLAVEEHYYLTYPLIFAACLKVPSRLISVLLAVLVGALMLRFVYFLRGADTGLIYVSTETRIDSIAYGCIAALILWYLPASVADRVGRYRMMIAGVALALLVVSIVLRAAFFRDTLRYSLQGAALVLLFMSLYIGRSDALGLRLLEIPVLKWMGHMSYGAYLWHLEAADLVERLLGMPMETGLSLKSAVLAPVLVVFSFGVAWLSFEAFQRPVASLRRRFGAMPRTPAA